MSVASVITAERNWHVENVDTLEGMRMLPDRCVNAVVTSPPYYALRSYLPADHPDKAKEHGSEPTPEAFIATMVEVFEEVRRVLRDDGVVWVNLGDSYNGSGGAGGEGKQHTNRGASSKPDNRGGWNTLKPGDKLNMPHRVAEALQAAGWWWRDTVIWHKKSPMPESVSGWKWVRCKVKVKAGGFPKHSTADDPDVQQWPTMNDLPLAEWSPCPGCPKCLPNNGLVLRRGRWRCTQAHEYVFMFAKSDEYFCDGNAAAEKAIHAGRVVITTEQGMGRQAGGSGKKASGNAVAGSAVLVGEFANPRNVWSLSHEPTKEKHFAAYPTELVRKCLLPSLAHAYCVECGAPHAPIVEEERKATRPALTNKIWKHEDGDHVGQRSDDSPNLDPERHIKCSTVVGYKATCSCNAGTTSGLVMDPYCGTGTTGEVALKMGARFLGFELNPEYKAMADRRVMKKLPLFVS